MSTLPIVNMFLSYLTDERHFSPYTARCYGADLRQYTEYLTEELGRPIEMSHEQAVIDAHTDPSRSGAPSADVLATIGPKTVTEMMIKADAETIRGFLAHLADQNYSPATTARKIATLRSYYKWALKHTIVESNPMIVIRTPRQGKRLPKAITVDQVEQLLAAPDDRDVLGARDRAMLETLYSTGIRVSELVDLDLEDLNDGNEALRVRGSNAPFDTRNWNRSAKVVIGTRLEVEWVDLDDPESPNDDLRQIGRAHV